MPLIVVIKNSPRFRKRSFAPFQYKTLITFLVQYKTLIAFLVKIKETHNPIKVLTKEKPQDCHQRLKTLPIGPRLLPNYYAPDTPYIEEVVEQLNMGTQPLIKDLAVLQKKKPKSDH